MLKRKTFEPVFKIIFSLLALFVPNFALAICLLIELFYMEMLQSAILSLLVPLYPTTLSSGGVKDLAG